MPTTTEPHERREQRRDPNRQQGRFRLHPKAKGNNRSSASPQSARLEPARCASMFSMKPPPRILQSRAGAVNG
jgi:hypothetical protein